MPFIHFISEDRRADGLIQIVHDFQASLKDKNALSDTKFMGRIEVISFVKKAVDKKLISTDDEILDHCKPYVGVGVITITGGRFIHKEKLTLQESELLLYMNDVSIQIHATSNVS